MAALAAFFLWNCSGRDGEKTDKPVIAVSTPAIGRIVGEVVGDEAEVVVLIPSGTDPENYEPDMIAMKRLSKADAFVSMNTPGFEEKLAHQLSATMPQLRHIDLGTGIERIHDSHGHNNAVGDPHLLSSPSNALTATSNARQALSEMYPAGAEIFNRNAESFSTHLRNVRKQTSEILDEAKGRSFVVTHPSLSYFAKEFDLNQLALEENGKEVTPRQLALRLRQARDEGAVVVFYEQSHSPQQARQAARELGVNAEPIDFNAGDFPEQYLRVAEAIAQSH